MKLKMRMNKSVMNIFGLAVSLLLCASASASTVIADFEDFYMPGYGSLQSESAWYGQTGEGSFDSGAANFLNYWSYDAQYDMESWQGFSCSNMTDTVTAGYSNQFSAITGSGVNGSANYVVGFDGAPSGFSVQQPVMTFDSPLLLDGLYLTNTTYAYMSMVYGDIFTSPLGGPGGDEPDWLKVTIIGLDAGGNDLGNTEFILADYSFDDNSLDYAVSEWAWVDLESLGAVSGLRFEISGTDMGAWGLNTPAYFAMDGVTAVPEPASMTMLALGAIALVRRRS